MFGYFQRQLIQGRSTLYATCEKALLDLLYLYPFYKTETELVELRLDQNTLHENFDKTTWRTLGDRFQCAALERRMKLLEKVYGL